jgi:uncharacterized membrane protein
VCSDKGRQAYGTASLLLLLAYPFAVHLGILHGPLWPALLILLTLLLAPLWQQPSRPLRLGASLAALSLLALLLFTPLEQRQLLYLAPPAIILLLWVMFARTLLPGQVPLVTRIAALMHERLSPRLERYTRAVTWAWVLFFSALLLEVVWLALYAVPATWSLFTNFINYLLVGGFFLLEFSLRRLVLPREERLGMLEFFRALAHIDYRSLARR